MTRTRRTVEISDALWTALELMSREMSVDRDALVNQALFTFARFNGYVTPGSVAPHAKTEPAPGGGTVAPVAQPLASPPNAQRRPAESAPPAPSTPPSEAETTDPNVRLATGSAQPVTRAEPPPPSESAPLATAAIPTAVLAAAAEPKPASTTQAAPPTSLIARSEDAPPSSTAMPVEDEPPDDFELDDGLDDLPENGAIDWNVPKWTLANRRVSKVSGTVKGHDFSGTVLLFDAAGAPLGSLELGLPVDDDQVERVLVDEKRDARAWKQLANELEKAQHHGAATLALCRAIGSGEPVATIEKWLSEHTIQRQNRSARERAGSASHVLANMHRFGAPPARKAAYLIEELQQGAAPAAILRELAIDQDQYASSRAAADFIICAKALDPDHAAYYAYTQALIAMSLGDPDTARVCADQLRERSEAQATFLTTYLNGLFPTYDFWPGKDGIASFTSSIEAKPPVRKLADFRNAIQKAALRVKHLRGLLEAVVPTGSPWLVPSVDTLLARSKATLEGQEAISLEEWQLRSIPQLLRFARNEWARLSWLCWLAGLDAVALPSATTKPRSPNQVGDAWLQRGRIFEAKGNDTALDQAIEGEELERAKALLEISWCDTTPEQLDGANAAELGVPEATAVLQAFEWAANASVQSPFFAAAEGAEEEDEDGEDEGEDDEPADPPAPSAPQQPAPAAPIKTPAEQEAVHAPALPALAQPAGGGSGTSIEPAVDPEVVSGDRTAIVKPAGRKLWVQRDGHETIELVGMRFTVGRDPRCEIMIASPRVSREHAAILVDAETVLVTDLNSSNGTFFNGERVMRHVVSDGDVVQFGNEKVKFCFNDPGQ